MSLFLALAMFLSQSLLPAKPSVQHADFAASSSAATVSPGAALTLWVDVVPHRSIHIYAAGATDFQPVALVLTPNAGVSSSTASYSKPDVGTAQGSIGAVPAYGRPFRIALPVTVSKTTKAGAVLTVGGVVRYQACDDALCYPVTTAPVTWSIAVK